MKKWLSPVCAVVLCIIFMTIAVYATDVYTASPYANTIKNYERAYNAIYAAIEKQQTYLDITNIHIHDYDIMRIYEDVLNNSPEFFYVRSNLYYRYTSTGYVTSLSFSYSMGATARKEATAFYQMEISRIVAETESLCTTDLEKALYVHDMLIASFHYDEEKTVYDVYHFLSEQKGVCQAYALCYVAILREMDIPCFLIKSNEMQHSWNIVCIEGAWYHVDLTYDDPQPDRPGKVLHEYFLISDNAISGASTPHYGWISDIVCNSTVYDETGIWRNSNSRMVVMDGYFVYIREDHRSIERSTLFSDDNTVLYLFKDRWFVDHSSGAYWEDVCSGLAAYQEYLYFNTPTSIWKMDTSNGSCSILLTLNEADPNRNLYGFDIYKGNMEYLVGDDPNKERTAYLRTLKMLYAVDTTNVTNIFFPYTDVSHVSPYYDAIDFVYQKDWMHGYNQTDFAPYSSLTRAQFAAVLYRISDADAEETQTRYRDTEPSAWYAKYVGWVTEAGWMQGTDKDMFSPDCAITREEVYTVFAKFAAELLGEDTSDAVITAIDKSAISSWANYGVTYCWHMGLVEEKFSYVLSPQTPMQRCELAEIVYRLYGKEK